MFILFRGVARFFVTGVAGRGGGGGGLGEHYRECRRDEPCSGVWGFPSQKIFRFGGSAIFSTCHEICLLKIDLEYEMENNCKSL